MTDRAESGGQQDGFTAKILGSVTTVVPPPAHAWYRKEVTPTSCPHTHTITNYNS